MLYVIRSPHFSLGLFTGNVDQILKGDTTKHKNDRERDSMRETNSHDVKRMNKRQIFNKNLRWVKETSKINTYLEEIDRGRQK